MAVGLGVRSSLNVNGAAMSGASGVLDAFSAGILLYTGLVEASDVFRLGLGILSH